MRADEDGPAGQVDTQGAFADGTKDELLVSKPGGRALVAVCLVLLCAAGAEFVARGVLRAPGSSGDFAVFYTDSRAWVQGTNPYALNNLKTVARNAGGAPDTSLHNSANPPATFVVLAPVAVLPWPVAKTVWMCINTVAVVVLACGLVRLAGLSFTRPAGMLLAAGALALAPIHTGVAIGQLTAAVAACIVVAYLMSGKQRVWLGGLLLAIATALKPQMGLVFIGFEFVRTRFRVVLSATLLTALLFVVAIGWLGINQVDWWDSWYDNYHGFMHGGAGDPGPVNAGRHQLLNLHYPLRTFLQSRLLGQIITLSFVGALGATALAAIAKVRSRNAELLGLSVFGVLSLLAVYQRYYSAILLVFPLTWAVLACRSGRRLLPIVSLVLMAAFLAPGATALHVAEGKGYIPVAVADSWCWQGLVMPHQVYALAALAVVLVIAAWRERRRCRLAAVSADS